MLTGISLEATLLFLCARLHHSEIKSGNTARHVSAVSASEALHPILFCIAAVIRDTSELLARLHSNRMEIVPAQIPLRASSSNLEKCISDHASDHNAVTFSRTASTRILQEVLPLQSAKRSHVFSVCNAAITSSIKLRTPAK